MQREGENGWHIIVVEDSAADTDDAELRTDAAEAVQHALQNLAAERAESKADVQVGALPTVATPAIALIQIFQNLLSNAIKFCGEKPPRIEIGAESSSDQREWTFTVRDHGIGIPEDQLERVFMLFQRLNNRQRFPGNGLGLPMARKLVERYGGRMWAESVSQGGTRVSFTLPAADTLMPQAS